MTREEQTSAVFSWQYAMLKRIKFAMDHYGRTGWRGMPLGECTRLLERALSDMEDFPTVEKAADVANYAFMRAELLRAQKEGKCVRAHTDSMCEQETAQSPFVTLNSYRFRWVYYQGLRVLKRGEWIEIFTKLTREQLVKYLVAAPDDTRALEFEGVGLIDRQGLIQERA
jgi:hypothetical protein